MPNDELDDLVSMAVFASVAELGSFTAAAARLGLVKSVASARVARLERQLGVKLLHRTTRRVSLTPAGAALYPSCAEVARAAGEVRARASGDADAVRGRMRVNAPVSFGTRYLAPCIAAFVRAHPSVHVELTLQDDFVDPTTWDVVLRLGHVTDLELVARRFATMGIVACASPAYLERHGVPRHPLDLVGHACLRYAHVLSGREWRFETPDGALSVPVDGPVTTTDGSLLAQLAREGLGIAMVPWFLAQEPVLRGELVVVLDAFATMTIPCQAVHAHGHRAPARVRAFLDHLVEHFRVPPWSAPPWGAPPLS